MMLAVPQRLHCWTVLGAETVARYAEYIRPVILEIGVPAARITQP